MITNLRIVRVEPSSVGPGGTFQVEVAFEYSIEEAMGVFMTMSIGQRKPFGFTRHDVIEFSNTKEIRLPIGISTHAETFEFKLPTSGLIDGGRFIDISIKDGLYLDTREYDAITFIGYITPPPSYVSVIIVVVVLGAMAAFVVAMIKGGLSK